MEFLFSQDNILPARRTYQQSAGVASDRLYVVLGLAFHRAALAESMGSLCTRWDHDLIGYAQLTKLVWAAKLGETPSVSTGRNQGGTTGAHIANSTDGIFNGCLYTK